MNQAKEQYLEKIKKQVINLVYLIDSIKGHGDEYIDAKLRMLRKAQMELASLHWEKNYNDSNN